MNQKKSLLPLPGTNATEEEFSAALAVDLDGIAAAFGVSADQLAELIKMGESTYQAMRKRNAIACAGTQGGDRSWYAAVARAR